MNKKRLLFVCSLTCLFACLWQSSFAAESPQSDNIRISGTVIDENREPLAGVTVAIADTNTATITNPDGVFYLEVPSQSNVLIFRYLGYFTQEMTVGGKIYFEVQMEADVATLDEVIVTGFGNQRRLSVVGAISTIAPEELQIGSSRSMTNVLGGQVAGIITSRRAGGEPGYDDSDFWIRGVATMGYSKPLILIDGIERDLNSIDSAEIESFSVLKDASASAMYGVRGANGVIVITTKRGQIGAPRVNIRFEHAVQTPTKLPEFAGAADHMALLSELSPGRYTPEQIERTRTGYDPDIYPDVDWIDAITKKFAYNTHATINVSGGSDFLRYALTASYFNEQGIVERDHTLPYDTSIKQNQYGMRANVDLDITKTTTLRMNIGGYLRQRRGPTASIDGLFEQAFRTSSFIHPAIYSDGTIPMDDQPNPWATATRSGFKRDTWSNIQSMFSLEQNLKMITPGLKAKAVFSFDTSQLGTVTRGSIPQFWSVARERDDYGNLVHNTITVGSGDGSLSKGSDGDYGEKRVYFEATLTYDRSFGAHDVSALLLYNQQSFDKPWIGDQPNVQDPNAGALQPYRKQGIAGRLSYTYDNRYVAEVNFGYNGSENFEKGIRFGFFPSVAAGWLLSEEPFMKSVKNVLSKFKLRGSIGLAGNDNIPFGRRFAYLTTIEGGGSYGWGGENFGGLREGQFGITDMTWETALKYDVGLEISLWNALDFQVDIFKEKRDDIFIQRRRNPNQAGFQNAPFDNFGKTENKGIELSMEFRKAFSKDFQASFRGNFTSIKSAVIENDEPDDIRGTHRSYIGHPINTYACLIAERLFTENDFIGINSRGEWMLKPGVPKQNVGATTVRPGDIKYKDMNGDGTIDFIDTTVIDDYTDPRVMYGFGGSVRYKSVDFSFFFQGQGKVGRIIGIGYDIFLPGSGAGKGNPYANYNDRWTEANPSQDVFWPRLAERDNEQNRTPSTWWLKDVSFLRLKSVELGYSFNPKWIKKAGLTGLRVYVSGNDLFYFSPFKMWDPELETSSGLRYPFMKSVMFGINLNF